MTTQLTIYMSYDNTIDYMHGQMTTQLIINSQMTIQLTIYLV